MIRFQLSASSADAAEIDALTRALGGAGLRLIRSVGDDPPFARNVHRLLIDLGFQVGHLDVGELDERFDGLVLRLVVELAPGDRP